MKVTSEMYLNTSQISNSQHQNYKEWRQHGSDVEDHHFSPPASKLITELVEKPKLGLTPDEAVVAEAKSELTVVLDVYQRLKKTSSGFLGGDKFTSADLTHSPNLHYLMGTPIRELFEPFSLLSSWCKELLTRPAWAKVVDLVRKHT
ncbi:Glutathione S-transferase-like protein [Drosera capensis]